MRDKIPAVLFISFALLDVALTSIALTFLGAQEINPVAAWLWNFGETNNILGGGTFMLLGGKGILFTLVGSYLRNFPRSGRWVLWLCAIIQIAAVTIPLTVYLIGTR